MNPILRQPLRIELQRHYIAWSLRLEYSSEEFLLNLLGKLIFERRMRGRTFRDLYYEVYPDGRGFGHGSESESRLKKELADQSIADVHTVELERLRCETKARKAWKEIEEKGGAKISVASVGPYRYGSGGGRRVVRKAAGLS